MKLAAELSSYGITDFGSPMPKQIFSWQHLFSLKGFLLMIVGGFMVGFGTRVAAPAATPLWAYLHCNGHH